MTETPREISPDDYDPTSNWLWLVELDRPQRCLLVGASRPALGRSLAALFTEVEVLDPAPPPDRFALPHPPGSFDCICLAPQAYPESGLAFAGRPESLTELRRVLERGGCCYVPGGFSRGPRSLLQMVGADPLARALRRAGFREVRTYYTDPSNEQTRSIIPAVAAASATYEILGHGRLRDRLRAQAARMGLHGLLFRHRFHLAYA